VNVLEPLNIVTPVPPPLIEVPSVPVCDPLDQPVSVPSSNPAFGIDTELPVALAVIGETQAIINRNRRIQDPFRGLNCNLKTSIKSLVIVMRKT
jgi:hypothetical protein